MKFLNDIYSNTFYFWLIIYIYIYVYTKLTVYENRSGSSNLLSNTVKKYISVCLFKILI